MSRIRVGGASVVINNEPGTHIQAATHRRTVRCVRDDLEANAVFVESGGSPLLLIGCDLVGLQLDYVDRLLPRLATSCGLPAERILVGCTHTHAGPAILGPTCPGKPLDEAYLERLAGWLEDVARRAVEGAGPGRLAVGRGRARIGYNRRCCWADGTHTMHGDTTRPDFTGLEGDSDDQHTALFALDADDRLAAILYHNTTHTTTFYGADFLSADFPGLARQYFRELFGPIPVAFLNGAQGDISLESQLAGRGRRGSREEKMARAAHLVTGETLRLLHEAEFTGDLRIDHALERLEVGIRLPSEARLAWARACLAEAQASDRLDLEVATAFGTVLLHERYAAAPRETIALHVGRIGDLSFVSVPCELFSHFAARIRARSPFAGTCVFGMTQGDMGYCPTTEALMGGHWGGDPTIASRWEPTAGYRIVDEAARLLRGLRQD